MEKEKLIFSDGYIEETEQGLTCVGKNAVEAGIIIRKTESSLKLFKKAFNLEVKRQKELLKK